MANAWHDWLSLVLDTLVLLRSLQVSLTWTKALGLRHFFETFQKCTTHNSGWTSLFFGRPVFEIFEITLIFFRKYFEMLWNLGLSDFYQNLGLSEFLQIPGLSEFLVNPTLSEFLVNPRLSEFLVNPRLSEFFRKILDLSFFRFFFFLACRLHTHTHSISSNANHQKLQYTR